MLAGILKYRSLPEPRAGASLRLGNLLGAALMLVCTHAPHTDARDMTSVVTDNVAREDFPAALGQTACHLRHDERRERRYARDCGPRAVAFHADNAGNTVMPLPRRIATSFAPAASARRVKISFRVNGQENGVAEFDLDDQSASAGRVTTYAGHRRLVTIEHAWARSLDQVAVVRWTSDDDRLLLVSVHGDSPRYRALTLIDPKITDTHTLVIPLDMRTATRSPASTVRHRVCGRASTSLECEFLRRFAATLHHYRPLPIDVSRFENRDRRRTSPLP